MGILERNWEETKQNKSKIGRKKKKNYVRVNSE